MFLKFLKETNGIFKSCVEYISFLKCEGFGSARKSFFSSHVSSFDCKSGKLCSGGKLRSVLVVSIAARVHFDPSRVNLLRFINLQL